MSTMSSGRRFGIVFVVVSASSGAFGQAPPPSQIGSFTPPYVWGVIPNPGLPCDCTSCPNPSNCPPLVADREIGHAALLSTGPNKGQVLLWYYELEAGTRTYLFNPASPGTLTPVANVLPNGCVNCGYANEVPYNIFCASHSFDADGRLIACGGIPTVGLSGAPPSSCLPTPFVNFGPGGETPPIYDTVNTFAASCYPCSVINTTFVFLPGDATTPAAWGQGPNMHQSRYYPSSLAVPGASLSTSGGTFVPGFPVVIGGTLDALCGDHHPGLPGYALWPSPTTATTRLVDGRYIYGWEYPVQTAPNAHAFVQLGASAGPTGYVGTPPPSSTLPSTPSPPEYYRFYPQAFLLGNDNPAIEEVFVAGDTHFEWFGEGIADAANLPAPSSTFQTFQLTNAGAYSSKIALDPSSPNPVRIAPVVDRYYSSAVMLHTVGLRNRVIRIGGSRGYGISTDPSPAAPLGLGAQSSHPSVEEFDFSANLWRPKAQLQSPRLFQNAVILPDGKILVVGGCARDYHNDKSGGVITQSVVETNVSV
jgi:hypothetical protein